MATPFLHVPESDELPPLVGRVLLDLLFEGCSHTRPFTSTERDFRAGFARWIMYVQYVKEKSTNERTPVSQPIVLVLYLCPLRAPLP